MDFEALLLQRQSCRSYDPHRSVSREDLRQCLDAARMAPSACNAQPYHFTIAEGETAEAVGALTRSMGMNGFTKDVRHFIVISEDAYNRTAAAGAKLKDQDYRSVDIGITTAYLTARAAELGLATCIMGWFDEKKLFALLDLKTRIRLVIAIGYAKEGDPIRAKKRKDLDELVSWK